MQLDAQFILEGFLDDISALTSDTFAEKYVRNALQDEHTLLEIFDIMRAKDKVVVTYDVPLSILRILMYLGSFIGINVVVRKLASEPGIILGYFHPRTNKIFLLIDSNLELSNNINRDVSLMLKEVFVHELVHYTAHNYPRKFCAKWDPVLKKFFKAVFQPLDPKLKKFRIPSTYYSNIKTSTEALRTGSDRLLLKNAIETHTHVQVKNKNINQVISAMMSDDDYRRFVMTILKPENQQENLYPYLFNAYKQITGEPIYHTLFFQELYVADEVICVLSQTNKFRSNVLNFILQAIK